MSISKTSRIPRESGKGSRKGKAKQASFHRDMKPVECPFDTCDGEFERCPTTELWHHLEEAHGVHPYEHVCVKCGVRFQNKVKLDNHLKDPMGHPPNRCEFCHQFFDGSDWKQSLKAHVDKRHSGERHVNFFGKCAICSRQVLLMRLELHLKMHLKQRRGGKRSSKRKSSETSDVDGVLEEQEADETAASFESEMTDTGARNGQDSSLSPNCTMVAIADNDGHLDQPYEGYEYAAEIPSDADVNMNGKRAIPNEFFSPIPRKCKLDENENDLSSASAEIPSFGPLQYINPVPGSSQESSFCFKRAEDGYIPWCENNDYTFSMDETTSGDGSASSHQDLLFSHQPVTNTEGEGQLCVLVPPTSSPNSAADVESILKCLQRTYSLSYDLSILKNCQYKIKDGELFYEWTLGPPSYDSETMDNLMKYLIYG